MASSMPDENLRSVVRMSELMLDLANRGDEHRQDAGCGAVYGALRDMAYKIRAIAEKELERHKAGARGSAGKSAVSARAPSGATGMTMSKTKRILVVDDEPDVVTFLATLFQDNGYEVVTAGDGVDAFRLAKSESPDLITLDMSMPEQSGVRTFRDLKADPVLARIPVIIVTGIGEPMRGFLEKIKKAPEPEGFIAKPIDKAELLQLVQKLTA